jgi:hypothetical protein
MSTFWPTAWAWIKRYLLAPLPALIIVAVALLLVAVGFKNIQIGGLLGKLFGKPDGKKAIDVANSVPDHRVDANGNLIPVGTPDAQGITQAVVVPIQTGGLFSDPTVVKVTPPGSDKEVVVHLPTGVTSSDVHQVVIVSPEVVAVTTKDNSKVTVGQVDDLLKKYGS